MKRGVEWAFERPTLQMHRDLAVPVSAHAWYQCVWQFGKMSWTSRDMGLSEKRVPQNPIVYHHFLCLITLFGYFLGIGYITFPDTPMWHQAHQIQGHIFWSELSVSTSPRSVCWSPWNGHVLTTSRSPLKNSTMLSDSFSSTYVKVSKHGSWTPKYGYGPGSTLLAP